MKRSIVERKGLATEELELIERLIALIPHNERRSAMGDVTRTLLEGKPRLAETVFGWNRHTVEVGLNEHRTGISCINDITTRVKPKTEDKYPQMLADIQMIMEPYSESDASLRTTLLHTNMTAKTVREALIQKGYSDEELPCERTFNNLLERQDYRLRTVAKDKVQKKQTKRTQSLKM